MYFFTCICLAVSFVTGGGEMFLAPRAKGEGKVMMLTLLPVKAHSKFSDHHWGCTILCKDKPVIHYREFLYDRKSLLDLALIPLFHLLFHSGKQLSLRQTSMSVLEV